MGKKQLPSLFVMLICQIIEKKTFPIASRDIQTGFFIFFALLLFSLMAFMTMRSVIDDGMTTWRVLSFFSLRVGRGGLNCLNLWLWEERRSRFLLFKIRKNKKLKKVKKKWRNFIEKSSIFVFNENCRKFFPPSDSWKFINKNFFLTNFWHHLPRQQKHTLTKWLPNKQIDCRNCECARCCQTIKENHRVASACTLVLDTLLLLWIIVWWKFNLLSARVCMHSGFLWRKYKLIYGIFTCFCLSELLIYGFMFFF